MVIIKNTTKLHKREKIKAKTQKINVTRPTKVTKQKVEIQNVRMNQAIYSGDYTRQVKAAMQ